MQVTIDIPEPTYRQLEAIAAEQNTSVDMVVVDRLRKAEGIPFTADELRNRYPLIQSKHPNSITVEQVAEFDLFDPS
jgi:hypothetical protein